MADWINIEEGTYDVDEAFLMTSGHTAITLADPLVEVYISKDGDRRLKCNGFAVNALLVELLEDYDDIDLLLDLGGEFKYLFAAPILSAGKVFSPDVKGLVHFTPHGPPQRLTSSEYQLIKSRLTLLDLPNS